MVPGRWVQVASPSVLYTAKHVSFAQVDWPGNANNNKIYFTAGDHSGGIYNSSYRQDTYSMDLAAKLAAPSTADAGVTLEYPFCGYNNEWQPKMPDFMGWTWDSNRHVFWQVTGLYVSSTSQCIAEGETSDGVTNNPDSTHPGFAMGNFQFNPSTQRWSAPLSGTYSYGNTWGTVFDPDHDEIVKWSSVSNNQLLTVNATTFEPTLYSGDAITNTVAESRMAIDLVGRRAYSYDENLQILTIINLDNHTVNTEPGVNNPGYPGLGQALVAWNSVDHLLYYFTNEYQNIVGWTNGLYAYHPTSYGGPLAGTWETLSMEVATNASGLSLGVPGSQVGGYDANLNAFFVCCNMGDFPSTPPGTMYLYKYNSTQSGTQVSGKINLGGKVSVR